MKTNYKNEIYKIIEISYKHKVSHIPSALSQMMYFKYIIPRVKDFDWVAGKQFGWQAYVVYDERIKPEEIDVILLNGINKDNDELIILKKEKEELVECRDNLINFNTIDDFL